MRKIMGACTLCDVIVADVKVKWPKGHLLAGEPRAITKFLPIARKVVFVCASGSTLDLTFCDQCVKLVNEPGFIPRVWNRVLESYEFELSDEYRRAVKTGTLSLAKQVEQMNWIQQQAILGIAAIRTP